MKTNQENGTPERGIRRIAGKRTLAAVLLFAGSMELYLGNGRGYIPPDSFRIRHLPVSLIRDRNLDLDEFKSLRLDQSSQRGFEQVILRRIDVPVRNFRMQVYSAIVPGGLWKSGETNVLLVRSTLRNPYAADTQDQRATFVSFSELRLNR